MLDFLSFDQIAQYSTFLVSLLSLCFLVHLKFNNLSLNEGLARARRAVVELPYFRSTKKLNYKDELVLSMLENSYEKGPCFVITDPYLQDNPIIFASEGFCQQSGYQKQEVEGRNCRFLQGPKTSQVDKKKIRDAIEAKKSVSVCILNYRKDGTTFLNNFFLCPLFDEDGKLAYYLGVQAEVKERGTDEKVNPGFRIFSYFETPVIQQDSTTAKAATPKKSR